MNFENYFPNNEQITNGSNSNTNHQMQNLIKTQLDHLDNEKNTFLSATPTTTKKTKLENETQSDSSEQQQKKLRTEEELLIVTTTQNGNEYELNSNSNSTNTTNQNDVTNQSSDCSNKASDLASTASSSIATTSNQQQATNSQTPKQILSSLLPSIDPTQIPEHLDEYSVCSILFKCMSDGIDISTITSSSFFSSLFLAKREKLDNINTIEQCVDLIYNSKNIIVLTGAGCSVSCGIPDFRSRDGVYARLRVDFPDLPDPQAMFDIYYFQHDPRPFFKFAKEIYPGQFRPSLSHLFVRKIEEHGKLLRNYTQNIDTLEMAAQIKNVIQCHGSFATATCTVCKYKVDSEFIREQIFNQDIPYCPKCKELQDSKATTSEEQTNQSSDEDEDFMPKFENSGVGILKPDIVFFGEGLPDHYHRSIELDKTKCDLLIVIGSSLKVKPVANIPDLLKSDVPQILINRESLKNQNFDIELLGDCDVIVNELLMRLEEKRLNDKINNNQLEWDNICVNKQRLSMIENDESEKIFLSSENRPNEQSKEVFNYNERFTLDYLKKIHFYI
jgi:NAD-dependent SIR2 family protein deacetylase